MPNESDKIVGRTLRDLRLRAGLTQVEFATNSGFTQSFVSKVENGSRSLKLGEIFDYAAALNIDTRALMSEISVTMNLAK